MGKRGKKYANTIEKLDLNKGYEIEDALRLAIDTSYAKFDASVDVAVAEWYGKNGQGPGFC